MSSEPAVTLITRERESISSTLAGPGSSAWPLAQIRAAPHEPPLADAQRTYNRAMQGEIIGVILVAAFAAAAVLCAVVVTRLWRA
jgi:hypothetical protein